MPSRDELLATAKRYLDAHNNQDMDAIKACCAASSTHRGGPPSIKGPDRTRDEYVAFNTEIFKHMSKYHAEMTDAVVDPETRKVALFLHATATMNVGEYENDYIITVTMTEDGKLVQDQYDFIDSHVMLQWLQKMQSSAPDIWEKK